MNTDWKVLWTLNHNMTENQLTDLKSLFDGSVAVYVLKDINSDLALQLANTPDDIQVLRVLANALLTTAKDYDFIVMPVGSPAFQDVFHSINANYGIPRLYSHSVRKSVDNTNADGTVTKTSVFQHVSWIKCN